VPGALDAAGLLSAAGLPEEQAAVSITNPAAPATTDRRIMTPPIS